MKNVGIILIVMAVCLIGFSRDSNAAPDLRLVPSKQNVDVGEQFTVDVVLENPQEEGFTNLLNWIKFIPSYLKVIDPGEDGSGITGPDTNISDAAYHSNFSFGEYFENAVDNTLGEINYQAAVGLLDPPLNSSGTFATITFEALNTTTGTLIWFDTEGTPIKDTTLVGADNFTEILGDTFGTTIAVIPEPSSLLLWGMGLLAGCVMKKTKVNR
ncbi:MAG: hypothetical protein KJ893_10545 [Candidatus Omnitrophica bacterium]|nr:hypothetical protein [Candidatus Omnitrophota bacterium]MBU4478295.1 hypothetical protein [Candidatus Omnitrophota bacterium]MCG2703363.1 cohesin domain-containing protein [Candidatus Omnitrophota bacterium]